MLDRVVQTLLPSYAPNLVICTLVVQNASTMQLMLVAHPNNHTLSMMATGSNSGQWEDKTLHYQGGGLWSWWYNQNLCTPSLSV